MPALKALSAAAAACVFLSAATAQSDAAQTQFDRETVRPMIDFSGVQEGLAGGPTQVLVLGTTHLSQLPEGAFKPAHLALVLERLEAFEPDIIAIEAVNGRTCDMMHRYASFYGSALQYCRDASDTLEALGLESPAEAWAAALELLDTLDAQMDDADRRRLAALLYAAGERWSGALHWSRLAPEARVAGDGVTEDLRGRLDAGLQSHNEYNQIGVELANRLGHDQLVSMDDHSADYVYAFSSDKLGETLREVWSTDVPGELETRGREAAFLGSPEGVLAGYRFLNSPGYQQLTIDADFGLAARTGINENVARHYLAWWQARGLRMAANVVEAAAQHPGEKVLVVVGASHKAYFDAYLDQMHDIELVSVDAVLAD